MTRTVFTIFLVLMTLVSFGQKKEKSKKEKSEKYDLGYDKDTRIIDVNGVEVFKFTEEKSALSPGMKNYTLYSLDDVMLILLVFNTNYANYFYEVFFFDENESSCEITYNFFKTTMALLDQNGLIVDGRLDEAAVKLFVMKNGNKLSR